MKGCIRSRVVRRIPDGNQASHHAEVQGLPWDTLKGSAEMLRNATVRPREPPRPSRGRPRKDGSPAQAKSATTSGRDDPMPGSSDDHRRQPTTEEDVVDQSIVMDSGTARVSDEGTDQGVLRMDQEEGISAEEQARRRLRSKQLARRSLTVDETGSKRLNERRRLLRSNKRFSNGCREARFGTCTKISLMHQNIEESRVDSCIENGRNQQVARKRSC